MVVYWNFGTNQQPGERLEALISTNGGQPFGLPKIITFANEYNELRFAPAPFYLRPRQIERRRTFMLFIKRCSGAILRLLLLDHPTEGLLGARRLQLAITRPAQEYSIQPSMFRLMAGPLRAPFMTTVLVRALGPELTSFGIADALLDPTLDLLDGNGNLVGSNDNWKDSQQAAI